MWSCVFCWWWSALSILIMLLDMGFLNIYTAFKMPPIEKLLEISVSWNFRCHHHNNNKKKNNTQSKQTIVCNKTLEYFVQQFTDIMELQTIKWFHFKRNLFNFMNVQSKMVDSSDKSRQECNSIKFQIYLYTYVCVFGF